MIGFGRAPCDDGVIRGGRETGGCAERSRPWVLAATILGSALGFIDSTVVNVALPAIQADLAASIEGAQWVVNGYMLMLGALTLVGGAAADRYGRRRVFTAGVLLFTAASVACGFAPVLHLQKVPPSHRQHMHVADGLLAPALGEGGAHGAANRFGGLVGVAAARARQ